MLGYVLTGVFCAIGGGAVVWIFKTKAVNAALADAKAAKEFYDSEVAKFKESVTAARNKVKSKL